MVPRATHQRKRSSVSAAIRNAYVRPETVRAGPRSRDARAPGVAGPAPRTVGGSPPDGAGPVHHQGVPMSRTLLATAAAVGALLVASASAAAQSPATQTLTFKEVDQGSTFALVDNPPRAPHRHGAPTHVSAGDLFVVSNRLIDTAGQPFGRLRAM